MHDYAGVGSFHDRRSLDDIAKRQLLAVVDRRFLERRPLDGARLSDGCLRYRLGERLSSEQLWPRRQRARPQAAHHDLELRTGQRGAAAVQLFVTVDEELAQR